MEVIIVTIVVYLLLMVVIGVIFSKKNNDVGDFYLGGRRLGPIVTAMSAEASDMSSYLLMGLPGLALLCGCAEVGWTAIGLGVGTYLNWLIVAKRLRVYSHRIGAITIPDFFSKRYGENKNVILGISALIILIFFIPYTASGFSACGKLFEQLFGWDYHAAMMISAAIIILYTSIGGFLAASTTDLIQSIVMTTALVVVVVFGINSAGGLDSVIENAKGLNGYLTLFENHNAADNTASPFGFINIISTAAWGLGYFGMPHILLRFMAIGDKNKIKTSRRIASVWVVISMGIAIFIGIIANALLKQGSIAIDLSNPATASSNSETAIIKMAFLMNENGVFAAVFAGLIFAGILACTMSTADSQLLAASSSASENLLKGVFKVKLSEKMSMLVARLVLMAIAVVAIIIAWDKDSSIFSVVSFAWAGFGATFGPVMLLALLWKRSNKYGAIAGLAAGGVMIFVWKFAVRTLGGAFDIYELLPAFIIALLADVIVSLATKAPAKEITDAYDGYQAEMKERA
ncbi:MAG: sodium/proline symporter [Ruminiclostridium sp.]|nr:sodium/proline symporter [Ruminiclostridium sp.]